MPEDDHRIAVRDFDPETRSLAHMLVDRMDEHGVLVRLEIEVQDGKAAFIRRHERYRERDLHHFDPPPPTPPNLGVPETREGRRRP
jgi:hypothetical protein